MALTNETLEIFFRFFKEADKGEPLESYSKRIGGDLLCYSEAREFRMFSYLTDLLGFNAFPKVLPEEEYHAIPTQQIFRGVKNVDHMASLLADYDYHKGDGTFGSGIYCATSYSRARTFADGNWRSTMAMRLTSDAKVIKQKELFAVLSAFQHDILSGESGYTFCPVRTKFRLNNMAKRNYKTLVDFCRAHKNDPLFDRFFDEVFTLPNSNVNLAMLLGYDAMIAGQLSDNYVVLNRGKIAVSESEFKRITNASKNYQGGVIDFDKKTEDEFLRE